MNLNFEILLENALKELPQEMRLDQLTTNAGTEHERYAVKDLWEIKENGIDQLGCNHEVIVTNLWYSIYGVIHGLARYCTKVQPSDLRREEIQRDFESRLLDAYNSDDLGWSTADKNLISEYFKSNNHSTRMAVKDLMNKYVKIRLPANLDKNIFDEIDPADLDYYTVTIISTYIAKAGHLDLKSIEELHGYASTISKALPSLGGKANEYFHTLYKMSSLILINVEQHS